MQAETLYLTNKYFLYFSGINLAMKNVPLVGCLLVFAGSFLPLVHIPLVGNWGYWKLDHTMAIMVWSVSCVALASILFNKVKLTRILAIILLFLFAITLFAIKAKSLNFFSFIPFKGLQNTMAGIVKLSWGWLFEFSGALLMLLAKNNKTENQNL